MTNRRGTRADQHDRTARQTPLEPLEPRRLLTTAAPAAAAPMTDFWAPGEILMGDVVEVGGRGFFFARDTYATTNTLWVTDGTTAGTVPTDVTRTTSAPGGPTAAGARIYYMAADPVNGNELWTSDGTVAGTRRLTTFTDPAAVAASPTALNDQLFFVVTEPSVGRELWRTDGTVAGTRLVKDIHLPTAHPEYESPRHLQKVGDRLLFFATDGRHGMELWSSDGTEAGTAMVVDFSPGGSTTPIVTHADGGRMFFNANAPNDVGQELYVTDGTAAGTRLVKDIAPGSAHGDPRRFVSMGGNVYFAATDAAGQTLWVTDGTEAGTRMVVDPAPGNAFGGVEEVAATGSLVFFVSNGQLWRSDGTADGSFVVGKAPHRQGWTLEPLMWPIGQRIVFDQMTTETGREPWSSDGTVAGTGPLGDLTAGPLGGGANPRGRVGGRLVMLPHDLTHGRTPWTTDGTPANTRLLKELPARPATVQFNGLHRSGDKLYAFGRYSTSALGNIEAVWVADGKPSDGRPLGAGFLWQWAETAPNGRVYFGSGGVWTSDGTRAGTVRLNANDVPQSFNKWPDTHTAVVGNTFYFVQRERSFGGATQLWKSNGTAATTQLVRSFAPWNSTGDYLGFLHDVRGKLVFAAYEPETGFEWWTSDGSAAGTRIIADLTPGTSSSAVTKDTVVAADGRLYFLNSTASVNNGLYVTDGTVAGTRFVADLLPGRPLTGIIGHATSVGSSLWFTYASEWPNVAVWHTDGTPENTRVVTDGVSYISGLAYHNGALLMGVAGGIDRNTLNRVDPATGQRTVIARFAENPSGNSSPRSIVPTAGGIYFSAATADNGQELWFSDGTAAGTRLAHDTVPGTGSGHPYWITAVDGGVWFTSGDRIWATPPYDQVAPRLLASEANLTTGRRVRFTFGEDVGPSLQPTDLTVRNLTTGQTLAPSQVLLQYDPATLTATFSLDGAVPDGNYRVTLAGVTDAAGNAVAEAAVEFFLLAGDFNRDRTADFADLGILLNNYNASGKTNSDGDANYDGVVDFADLGLLLNNYNKTLAAPATVAGVPEPAPASPPVLVREPPTKTKGPKKAKPVAALPAVRGSDR